MTARRRRILRALLAALTVAALTGVVFLVRAGDPGSTGWPISWELRSSDNGVLFQFVQDVFAGRSLDWSFSPQVFVFPELPISFVAYLVAGGSVQGYYLVVAMMNNALLFLALFALVRVIFPAETFCTRLARAGVASLPLLVLPLLASSWLFSYQLAPTYYFGMYLMILVAPLLFATRSVPVRVVLAAGIVLAGASNPLGFVFTVPAFAIVLVIRGFGNGWRTLRRPLLETGAVLVAALIVRLVFFSRLQGGSPLAYMDTTIFAGRLSAIDAYLRAQLSDPMSATLLILGALCALAALGFAVDFALRYLRQGARRPQVTVSLYLALVPVTGLAGTLVLIITDYLYLWPVIVLPISLVLMAVRTAWIPWALSVGTAGFVVAALLVGAIPNLAASPAYFTYRGAETRCLDEKLPAGVDVGYATFSDARRLSLTSERPFRLIQLKSSAVRAYWLTNRDYARDDIGRFFYLNDAGDEPAIDRGYITSHFGEPDRQFSCGAGQTVWIYDSPAKLDRITARYAEMPIP